MATTQSAAIAIAACALALAACGELEKNDADVRLVDEDDFSSDRIASGRWVVTSATPDFGGGPLVNGVPVIQGGQLAPSDTAENLIARDISLTDETITAKFLTGTNDVGHGRVQRVVPDGYFAFDFNIGTNLCRLRYRLPNPIGEVSLQTGGVTGGVLAAQTEYWAQIEFDGNEVTGRLYDADPFGSPTPTPIGTRTHTLTGDAALGLGEGVFGNPGLGFFAHTDLNWRADDFRAEGIAEPET